MPWYMDDWNEEYEYALIRAEREAEENGEEFDEDEWRRNRLRPPASEIDDAIDQEIDEFMEEQDNLDEDTGETEPDDHEDAPSKESSGERHQESDKKVREYPEDPWAEDEHRQRNRKGSGGHISNSGLRQAEQNAGDFYNYAHMEPDDGHGISVPQLTAFDKDDDEKSFRKPENGEDRNSRKMDRVSHKYEKNEGVDDEFDHDDDFTLFDEWVDSMILSSPDEHDDEYEPEERLTDYEDDILSKAAEQVSEFYANGGEEEHFRRLRDDSSYGTDPDREIYNLHRELKSKLDMYEDRMSDDPHDNTYYLPYVHGALEAVDDARHLSFKNRKRKEELKEMHEAGELSDMQYAENEIALDHRLRRQLTDNQYKAISGGNSMFEDIGEIMDHWNHLVDDTLSGEPEKMQDARNFISQLPREVANQLIDSAVDDGLLNRSQADHLMTMAARPTNSLSHAPKSKKRGFGNKVKNFFRL